MRRPDGTSVVAGTVAGRGVGDEHYRVSVGLDHVHASATKPLSFDPKDWRRKLRTELLAGLTGLNGENRALIAQFWDRDRRVLDLENAVMYNVGLAPFTAFLPGGLWFRRHDAEFLPQMPVTQGPTAAQYAYSAVDVAVLQLCQIPRNAVALSFVLPRPVAVRETWRAVRESLQPQGILQDWSSRRLGVSVEAPRGTSAGALKPLLDGIVSAFHVTEDGIAANVLRGWGADEAELALLLQGPAPLGPRRLITLSGDRPAWNPADDLFDEIVVRCSRTDDLCAAEVYPLD